MDKTINYQLNQWDAEDRVLRTDFNADNAKLDAALDAEAKAREALALTVPKIAFGAYAGDGAESRTIPLPFAPKAVLVICADGTTNALGDVFGGLAVTGSPVMETYSSQTVTALEIVPGGFRVGRKNIDHRRSATNDSGKTYNYIAFG